MVLGRASNGVYLDLYKNGVNVFLPLCKFTQWIICELDGTHKDYWLHRTIQKIKLYFWEFCPNISWTPTGIALVETKLCPLDCATTTKLQQRLERQGLLHKSFYVWSTGGKPKDRTCMDSLTICLLNTVSTIDGCVSRNSFIFYMHFRAVEHIQSRCDQEFWMFNVLGRAVAPVRLPKFRNFQADFQDP